MGRSTWVVLGLILLALLGYLLWPSGEDAAASYRFLPRTPRAEWTLTTPGLVQHYDGETFTINGYPRPVDVMAVRGLWSELRGLRTSADALTGIDPGELVAYGIDGSSRLEAERVDLRWAEHDGLLWVYDGIRERLLRFDAAAAARLGEALGRLDHASLLAPTLRPQELRVDGLHLRASGNSWVYLGERARPPADGRVARLFQRLADLRCSELDPASTPAELSAGAQTLTITTEGGEELSLALIGSGDDQRVVTAHLPPQPVGVELAAALREHLAALHEDRLLDLAAAVREPDISEVVITRGARELFRLERSGRRDRSPDGLSNWWVVWPGGRVPARPEVAGEWFQAMNRVTVREARQRDQALESPPRPDGSLTVRVTGVHLPEALWLQLGPGPVVASPGWTASLVGEPPAALADPQIADVLQRRLLTAAPARISKLQRVTFGAELAGEILRSGPRGWELVSVSGSVDAPGLGEPQALSAAAAARLAEAVVSAEALAVHIAGPEDLALRSAPERTEIAVHIEALPMGDAGEFDRLIDTAARDWGLAMVPLAESDPRVWAAVELTGSLAYRLADDTVQAWLAPVQERAVLALSPSRVQSLRVVPVVGTGYRLLRRGDEWLVRLADERLFTADATAVRAFLLQLARLDFASWDRDALPLAASGAVTGTLTVELPAVGGGPPRLQELVVGDAAADGVLASTGTGRMRLELSDPRALIPPVGRFLSAEDRRALAAEAAAQEGGAAAEAAP